MTTLLSLTDTPNSYDNNKYLKSAVSGTEWSTLSGIDHSELVNIQGGIIGQYYHLTSTQHNDLTNGGNTTLHLHDSRYYTESEIDNILNEKSSWNLCVGTNAGINIIAGDGNVCIGYEAGTNIIDDNYNTIVGALSGDSLLVGGQNTLLGALVARDLTTGTNNIVVGCSSGSSLKSGTGNVMIGVAAGGGLDIGNYNILIGHLTKAGQKDNDYNIVVGYDAGNSNLGGYNTFIGYKAGYNETGSCKLYIENSDSSSPLIYGEFDNDFVRINGDLDIVGNLTFSGTICSGIKSISEDLCPELGADLDVNGHSIDFGPVLTASGICKGSTMIVNVSDSDSCFGDPLYSTADFQYERANASSMDTMPCLVLALENGSGNKRVLVEGQISKSEWSWSNGFIYIDIVDGGLRQADPSISGTSLCQKIGWALNSSTMYFKPSFEMSEITSSGSLSWLGTWAKRRKLTVSNSFVDQDLSHYPLPVRIGSSVGSNDADVSDIFDDLGANAKKLAVTKEDGITPLYVEIEKWDHVSEDALLWVSRDDWTIASGTDTTIYLYYDNNQADNTDYIGDIGDTPAQNVWDTNFVGVWHLDNSLKDSTNNCIDGTNSNTSNSENGILMQCREYDASSDYVEVDDLITEIANATTGTMSAWGKISTETDSNHALGMAVSRSSDSTLCQIVTDWNTNADRLEVHCYLNGWKWYITSPSNCLDPYWNEWTLTTVTHNGIEPVVYINDSVFNTSFADSTDKTCWWKAAITDAASPAHLATIGNYRKYDGSPIGWNDLMDEVRVSVTVRSNAWIKMDYNTGLDNVLSYGSIE